MSFRDLFVFGVVIVTLPMAFRRPFIGLLVFSWLAYMRPQDLCWGFARNMRFSFLVGITMVVGFFANEIGRRRFWQPDVRTVAMLLLLVFTTIGLLLAENTGSRVMRYYVEFAKIIVVALFTTGQVDSRQRLRFLLWTIAGCLGFYGFKGGLFGLMTGGTIIQRGPGGMLEDNNDFALALLMNIPLLFYLGRSEGIAWLRRICDFTIVLTVITILLTHSRGAFVATVGMLLLMAWRSGKLIRAFAMLGVCAGAFFAFAPQHVLDRIATIQQGGEESSAGARLISWQIALRMIAANPVVGVGMRNFRDHYARHGEGLLPPGQNFKYVAHNSYLQIWAEGGSLSFATYLLLLASVWFACRNIRGFARGRPDLQWAVDYARMMEATTFGFAIGAFFLNRGHFDLIYHWFALLTALSVVFHRELVRRAAPAEQPSAARGVRVRWRTGVAGPSMLPRW